MDELIRINKYISDTGFCSRREADKLIADGYVTINGKKAEMGTKVRPDDSILVKNKPIKTKRKKVYIAFNKPAGITCTTDKKDKDNIIDFIGYRERIFPIGRLDKMSEGLIFLTNDGNIVNKILRAGNNHDKEYIVTTDKLITNDFIKKMGRGVKILKTITQPCRVNRLGGYKFKIVLKQGLNRQIRRMCEKLGYEVLRLVRVRIMNITLKGIQPGRWRYINENEMKTINRMLLLSSKTEEASNFNKKHYSRK